MLSCYPTARCDWTDILLLCLLACYFVTLAAPRVAGVAVLDVFLRWSAKFFPKIRIGLAMKIDEYVPIIMPITSAYENPFSTWPPKRYRDNAVSSVRPEVNTVRLNVWLMLAFTSSLKEPRRCSLMFSRIRSKTTMVSFIE